MRFSLCLASSAVLLSSRLAFAQMDPMMGGGAPGGTMGGAPGQAAGGAGGQRPDPKTPQTHAASGAADESLGTLPSLEASLPKDPIKISPELRLRLGSDADTDVEQRSGSTRSYRWYGPYYEEKTGNYQLRTVFPLWMERKQPGDRASLFGPLYYNRRSKDHDADIVFPFYWNLRDQDTKTHVVGPLAWRRGPGVADNWLAPLYFQGTRADGSGYFHVPPLLTFTSWDKDGGSNIVGPGFCSWKGGSTCSTKSAREIDLGIAPFYFYGKTETSEYEVIPPLLHYYKYEDVGEKSTNIWGPLYWKRSREKNAFHVLPFFYHVWGEDEDHVTVLPFFHYGHSGKKKLFVNPLYLTATGENGESTFVTWGYARYRGRTELDMITPFYWQYRDPDIGQETKLLFPFLYSSTSPREQNFAFFPFWGHFDRYGIKKTTWVTPFVKHSHGLTGWETNINPFVYVGRYQNSSHTVVFPFFWDFASPNSRATVAFPVYWRFDDGDAMSQLVLNTYYRERKLKSGLDWEFHFFPAFSYGESPDGHWWKVLYGLAGYTRKGPMTKMYAAWIPFLLSGQEAP